MNDQLIARLLRYSEKCIADRLDADFAAAVGEAVKALGNSIPVPEGGIGEVSDGYHTFNGLYYQRMVLFAALVHAHQDKAWKSWKHEDGEPCFSGGWFIVGIDTPEGSYTYHYEDKYWDMFDCTELPEGKHWDGHTEKDVTRLLSLGEARSVVRAHWYWDKDGMDWGIGAWRCSACNTMSPMWWNTDRSPKHKSGNKFCPNCGAEMEES